MSSIPIIRGNLLDNIFGNFNAPMVYIPNDFSVSLGLSPEDS